MKNILHFLLIGMLILLASCNPKITTSLEKSYPATDSKQEIVVLRLDQTAPENAEVIGQVKVGDTGFTTNCDYSVVLEKAKNEARKAGGNVLKLTEYKAPSSLGSSCHRITAKILKVENIESIKPIEVIDSALMNGDYAILYFYRMDGKAPMVIYNLYMNGRKIAAVKNNWKKAVKVESTGKYTIWGTTESKIEQDFVVQVGHEYYIRCGVSTGAFVGIPSFELMDNIQGKMEYDAIAMEEPEKKAILILKDGREIECFIKKQYHKNVYFSIIKNRKKINTHISKEEILKIVNQHNELD